MTDPPHTEPQGWVATFVDGPMADNNQERHFTGHLSPELYFAPAAVQWAKWMLVGAGEGLEPDAPWDGQVKYVALDEIEPWPLGEPQVVRFRLESDGGDTGHSDEAKDPL